MGNLEVVEGKVFDVIGLQDRVIAQMAEQYLPLKIRDIEDKAGLKKVHEARMIVKGARVKVENKRKELDARKAEAERLENEEREKKAAKRPEREKVLAWVNEFEEDLGFPPDTKSPEAADIIREFQDGVARAAEVARDLVEELL